jgi:hypothetical protein
VRPSATEIDGHRRSPEVGIAGVHRSRPLRGDRMLIIVAAAGIVVGLTAFTY